MKKIIAINAGPRKGHNTDTLIHEAAKGAAAAGAEIEYIDLYTLKNIKGCISCFGCKLPNSYGKCAYQDDLTPILAKIRQADGLIIGSPNYLSDLSAGFRALYERLIFQVLTYNTEEPCANKHLIPALLIMTSNCPEEFYEQMGYHTLLSRYQQTMSRFVGPTSVLYCGNTVQVEDYSKYNWTQFDVAQRLKHHEETFSDYLKKAYELGAALISE